MLSTGSLSPFDMSGKRGVVIGIANEQSIAWGIAQKLHGAGAECAVSFLNEKAEKYVRPLAEKIKSPIILPLDVEKEGQLDAFFRAVADKWPRIDFLVHSIAFAPRDDLRGRVVDSSLAGFQKAMDISCHSFLRMESPQLIDPAALEASVRYAAAELGPRGIRVNAISAGAIPTRAASGIEGFDETQAAYKKKLPLPEPADQGDVGNMALFLLSEGGKSVTGGVHFVDGGYNILAP
ncbi:enoyl-reductase [Hyaloraphidium curvatum]|nr:enoyl-reductase [Hyaloraphidium curvatum]